MKTGSGPSAISGAQQARTATCRDRCCKKSWTRAPSCRSKSPSVCPCDIHDIRLRVALTQAVQHDPSFDYAASLAVVSITPSCCAGLIHQAMKKSDGNKFLIDGFPRALDQAEAFEHNVCESTAMLFLDCPEEVMTVRCRGLPTRSGSLHNSCYRPQRAQFRNTQLHQVLGKRMPSGAAGAPARPCRGPLRRQ